MFRSLHKFVIRSHFYGLFLKRCKSFDIKYIPQDPWSANTREIGMISEGCYKIDEEILTIDEIIDQIKLPSSEKLLIHIHSFDLLRSLRVSGDNFSRKLARQLISCWIENNYSYSQKSWCSHVWQPDLLGYRISNWLSNYEFFGRSADDDFRKSFASIVTRQLSFLERVYEWVPDHLAKLRALKGLIYGACACDDFKGKVVKFFDKYIFYLSKVASDDGYIFNRHPATCLIFLRDIIEIKALLRFEKFPNEKLEILDSYIKKIVPLIRLCRHNDGGLASFQGLSTKRDRLFVDSVSSENLIDTVLSLSEVRTKAISHANFDYYIKCSTKVANIIINCGKSIGSSFSKDFSGDSTAILDFEFGIGNNRFIESGDLLIQYGNEERIQINKNFQIQKINLEHSLVNGDGVAEVYCEAFYKDEKKKTSPFQNFDSNVLGFKHKRLLTIGCDGSLKGYDFIDLMGTNGLGALRFLMCKNIEVIPNPSKRNSAILLVGNKFFNAKENNVNNKKWRFLWEGNGNMVVQNHQERQAILVTFPLTQKESIEIKWSFYQEK
jgi:hypothetical protein